MRKRRRRRASWTPSSSTCPARCRICSRSNSTVNPAIGCWGTGALSPTTPPSVPLAPERGVPTPPAIPSCPVPQPDQKPAPSRPGRAPPTTPKGSSPGRTGRPGTKCTDVTSRQARGTQALPASPGWLLVPPALPLLFSQGTPVGSARLPSSPTLPSPFPLPPWAKPKAQSQAPCPQLPHPRSSGTGVPRGCPVCSCIGGLEGTPLPASLAP